MVDRIGERESCRGDRVGQSGVWNPEPVALGEFVLVTDGQTEAERYADYVLEVPATNRQNVAVVANVQLQLLAYWLANRLGGSINKPWNLAKSVTVE